MAPPPSPPAGPDAGLDSIAEKIDAGLTTAGDHADEIASLSSKVAVEYERLREMADVISEATPSLRSAIRFAR